MRRLRLAGLLLTAMSVFASRDVAHALDSTAASGIISRFLATQHAAGEDAQSQGSTIADLNRDGKPEIVLVWTLLGPTYWHNTLTVFSQTPRGYKAAASFP